MMRGKAQNNTVIIRDCNFLRNQAMWGGGLFVELLDDSRSNFFVLENLLFDSNHLPHDKFLNITGTGGGAVKISIASKFFSTYNATLQFTNCTF